MLNSKLKVGQTTEQSVLNQPIQSLSVSQPGSISSNGVIRLKPTNIVKTLLLIEGGLLLIHLTGIGLQQYGGRLFTRGFWGLALSLFDVDLERNIPTLFSTGLLFLSGLLFLILWKITTENRHTQLTWALMSATFMFLGIDEYAGIHEHLSGFMQERLHLTVFLFYAWVIPYAFLVLAVGIGFFRTWLKLPRSIRRCFTLAAVTYVGGAMGAEVIAGVWATGGEGSLVYRLIATVEEGLEMLGAIILIYGLLALLRHQLTSWVIVVTET